MSTTKEHKSLEAEKALISALLSDPQAMTEVSSLKPEMFAEKDHQVIFRTIKEMFSNGEPIDLVTVIQRLPDKYFQYVSEISDICLSSIHIKAHAKIIKDHYRKREYVSILNGAIGELDKAGADPQAIKDLVTKSLNTDDDEDNDIISSQDSLSLWVDNIEAKKRGDKEVEIFTTGIDEIDQIAKLKRGKVVVIGGRPGHGKSILAKTIAMNNAMQGKPVLMVSLEMNDQEQNNRAISELTGIHYNKFEDCTLLCEQDMSKIAAEAEKLATAKLFYTKSFNMTVSKIRTSALKLKARAGLDLVIVDYLQLITPEDKNIIREQQIEEISRRLKLLAGELEICVVLLIQLNRECEKRSGIDKMPILSDGRSSGTIEQDADIVIFSMIPAKYGIEKLHEIPLTENMILLRIAKNRQGRTLPFTIAEFNGETVSIRSNPNLYRQGIAGI
ncbi:MAG: DnaB-like helicase C-terminal domain-containing protein [Candidatus Cloacimonetes bacterium]|nr:DnaB-like helicase C-terminal domain-containing protein [Candidatus Cloacimonadota bacterium]